MKFINIKWNIMSFYKKIFCKIFINGFNLKNKIAFSLCYGPASYILHGPASYIRHIRRKLAINIYKKVLGVINLLKTSSALLQCGFLSRFAAKRMSELFRRLITPKTHFIHYTIYGGFKKHGPASYMKHIRQGPASYIKHIMHGLASYNLHGTDTLHKAYTP